MDFSKIDQMYIPEGKVDSIDINGERVWNTKYKVVSNGETLGFFPKGTVIDITNFNGDCFVVYKGKHLQGLCRYNDFNLKVNEDCWLSDTALLSAEKLTKYEVVSKYVEKAELRSSDIYIHTGDNDIYDIYIDDSYYGTLMSPIAIPLIGLYDNVTIKVNKSSKQPSPLVGLCFGSRYDNCRRPTGIGSSSVLLVAVANVSFNYDNNTLLEVGVVRAYGHITDLSGLTTRNPNSGDVSKYKLYTSKFSINISLSTSTQELSYATYVKYLDSNGDEVTIYSDIYHIPPWNKSDYDDILVYE